MLGDKGTADKPSRGIRNSLRFPQLMRSEIFDGFSEIEKIRLIDAARMQYFPEATDFIHQDQVPLGLYLVAQGQVEICYLSPAGTRTPLLIANVGMTLGGIECLANKTAAASGRATAGSCVLLIEKAQLSDLTTDPRFVRNLAAHMYEAMLRFNMFRSAEKDMNVPQRLAHYLLQLRYSDNSVRHSQTFIADTVGCSRQTVNKNLGRMRRDGVITIEKGVIQIKSEDVLLQWIDTVED